MNKCIGTEDDALSNKTSRYAFYDLMRSRLSVGSGTYTYTVDDKDALIYAGMIGTYLETNLGELEFGTDFWFEYENEDGESSVTGMPGDGEIFYLCIKYKEGLTQIYNFCFDYEYMNAGAQLTSYAGKMYQCENCGYYFSWDINSCTSRSACNTWNKSVHSYSLSKYYKDETGTRFDLMVADERSFF